MGLRGRERDMIFGAGSSSFSHKLNKRITGHEDASLTDALVCPTGGGKGTSVCFLPFTEQEVTMRPYGDVALRLGFTANLAAGRLFVAEQAGFLWRI